MKRTFKFSILFFTLAFVLSCNEAANDSGGDGSRDLTTTALEKQVAPPSDLWGNGAGGGLEPKTEPVLELVLEPVLESVLKPVLKSVLKSVPVLESENGTRIVPLEASPIANQFSAAVPDAGSPPLMGDGNADGCINGADFLLFGANRGTSSTAGSSDGDFNGDGVVDDLDYIILADNFGSCAAPAAIEEIQVTPDSGTLTAIGESIVLSAQSFDAAGQELEADFIWHSSNPSQLDVDQAGRVTAMGMGTAEIWAAASGVESLPAVLEMDLVDPNAYVTNTAAGVVTVINTLSDEVLATIPVGASPTRVAVTQDGARVYVANTGGNSVSVIDTSENAVVATIPVTNAPSAVAVTPNGAEVYLVGSGGVLQVIDTALIDTASDPVIATFSFGTPGFNEYATSIGILPDGTRVYAVVSGSLRVIDTATVSVLGSIDVGSSPSQLAIAPDGKRAYVTGVVGESQFGANGQLVNRGGECVVVDTVSNFVLNTIPLLNVPGSIAITPGGAHAYVAMVSTFANTNYGMGFTPDNHVAVIDLVTNGISDWIIVPATAAEMGITPDGLRVYVSIPAADSIAVIDTETGTLETTIGVDAVPTGLAIASAQAPAE